MVATLLVSLALAAPPVFDDGRLVGLVDDLDAADPAIRVAAARALAGLRHPDAAAPLAAHASDPDPAVVRAVAEALGQTPEAAGAIRTWLGTLPPATGPADRAGEAGGVREALVDGLGRQGDAEAVDTLLGALAGGGPVGRAAAVALGRLSRREAEATRRAVPELVACLGRLQPSDGLACAFALGRIGMEGATEADLEAALKRLGTLLPDGRAFLVRGLLKGLPVADRGALLEVALLDPERQVRVAGLASLRKGDPGLERAIAALDDPDPWLRVTATSALGQLGGDAAIAALRARAAAWEPALAAYAAEALVALEVAPTAADLADPRPLVRAEWLSASKDPAVLVEALADDTTFVRTGAAVGLTGLEAPTTEVVDTMLRHADPVVRQSALEIVGTDKLAEKEATALVVRHLGSETDGDAIEAACKAITAWAGRGWKGTGAARRALRARLGHAEVRIRRAAFDALAALGSPEALPARVADAPTVPAPAVARVTTSRGSFSFLIEPERAPITVANFERLVQADFFDGVVFHRVVPAFVVQTGCPRGDGYGGPGWAIPDEVSLADYDLGTVGMARADRDTNGSQWFVTTASTPHLTGDYTRFGHVITGMEVVVRLQRGDTILDVAIER